MALQAQHVTFSHRLHELFIPLGYSTTEWPKERNQTKRVLPRLYLASYRVQGMYAHQGVVAGRWGFKRNLDEHYCVREVWN